MMLPRTLLAIAIAALTLQAPARAANPLDAFLRSRVEKGDVPGVVAVVVDAHWTVYEGAFGKADVERNRPMALDSIFRLASMTKPITTLAAMMLVEEGRLGLDEPITKYLPEFSHLRVFESIPRADGSFATHAPRRAIRIRDLLTHTSGMGYSFIDARLAELDDGRKGPADVPLVSEPGERFVYGPNTAVLGDIVAKVSGMPLDRFFETRIFEPLAMHDTAFTVPAAKRNRVVTMHARGADGSLKEMPNPVTLKSPVRGDGGLFSTAADYARFMQLFLNKGRAGDARLVSEHTIDLMTTNQIGALRVTTQNSTDLSIARPFPSGAGKDTFGFGFQIEGHPSEPGSRSEGSLSWGGIFNTHFWIDPHQSIAAVVLMQLVPYYDEPAIDVLRGFEHEVYRANR